MLDLKLITENPEKVQAALAKKGCTVDFTDVIAKDAKKKRLAVFKKNNARQRHGEPVKVDIKILKCRTAAPFTTAMVDSCNMFNCFMDCKEEAPARQGFKL